MLIKAEILSSQLYLALEGKMGMIAFYAGLIMGALLGIIVMAIISMNQKARAVLRPRED